MRRSSLVPEQQRVLVQFLFGGLLLLHTSLGAAQPLKEPSLRDTSNVFELARTWAAPEAHQAVAVDQQYMYAISNHAIGKYDKQTGEKVDGWSGAEGGAIQHLNSGVVIDGRLYCAHSNYPETPMTSSIEVWDTATMEHVDSHSFGIRWGSGTWVDRYNGSWWVAFAHYSGPGGVPDKGPKWTTLVRFDAGWVPREEWVYPQAVIDRFHPDSNSGGAWGPDGRLYVTGHDRNELYVLALPEAGSTLRLERIVPFPGEGQGIAFDPSRSGVLYGIRRSDHTIVVATPADSSARK